MPLTIKKILYATDLSKNSAYAFRYAVDIAKNHNADIHLLHVVEKLPPAHEAFVDYYLAVQDEGHHEKIVAESIDRTKKKLAAFRDREIPDQPEIIDDHVTIEVIEGYPVEEILSKSEEYDCDVIITGSHGKGFVSNALLGSVSERVFDRAHKPVIVVPLPEEETEASLPDF